MLRILAIMSLASSYAMAQYMNGGGAGWAGGNQGAGWQQGGQQGGWAQQQGLQGQQGWAGNQGGAGWSQGGGQQGWAQQAQQQLVDTSAVQQEQAAAPAAQEVVVADNSGAAQQQQQVADNSAAVVVDASQQQLSSGGADQSAAASSSVSAGASAGPALSESQLYGNVDYNQFAAGYGNAGKANTVERVDETPQQLQDVVDQAQGQDTAQDINFPDSNVNNRYDNTKEIHSYSTQRHITNRLDKNLRRYFKNLNVNSVYNTNIARIRHQKLINLLNVQVQDVHKPFLKVAYSRQDTVQDVGARDEQPIVENQATSQVLQPIVYPAQIQRVGYNGNLLGRGVGLNYGGGQSMSMYTSEYGY